MKSIMESAEVFEAYAQIDYCYYALKEVQNDLAKSSRSPLEIMIDNATGYGAEKDKECVEICISLLETIIDNKKIVEADYSGDEIMLGKLRLIMQKF